MLEVHFNAEKFPIKKEWQGKSIQIYAYQARI